MNHKDAPSTDEKPPQWSVVQTHTTKPDPTEQDSHPHPVDLNKIANHNNAERKKQVCSVVDQVIRDVMFLSELKWSEIGVTRVFGVVSPFLFTALRVVANQSCHDASRKVKVLKCLRLTFDQGPMLELVLPVASI